MSAGGVDEEIMSSGSTMTLPRSMRSAGTRCSTPGRADAFHAPRIPERCTLAQRGGRDRLGAGFAYRHAHGALIAACALYLKSHSYGEYVFDWAWADAYQRHGLAYYPKLLVRRALHAGAGLASAGARRRRARRCCCRRCTRSRGNRACRRPTCCSSTTPTAPRSSAPAGCCAKACSSTGRSDDPQPYADFDGLHSQPAAREAQEDPAGTPPRRRGRRELHACTKARLSTAPPGTSSTAATP